MKPWLNPKKPAALLGLALDGTQLEGTVVRLVNGRLQLGSTFRHAFSEDPLSGNATQLGRELRAALDAAGIRESHCTLALPADWALTHTSTLPDLPEADLQDLLQLEAEQGFAFPADSLSIATVRFESAPDRRHATQVAIHRDRIQQMTDLLRAARLQSASLTLGCVRIAEALAPGRDGGELTLVVSASQVELVARVRQGVLAVRTWPLPVDNAGRELRVTLGQLPAELQSALKRLRIVGKDAAVDSLAAELRPRADALGLAIEVTGTFPSPTGSGGLPDGTPVSPAVAVAAAHLATAPTPLEFQPPHVSAWQQFSQRYASRKLVAVGQVAGSIALLVALLFLWQQVQLARLESQWNGIVKRVHQAEDVQKQVKRFRAWDDDSFRSLAILRQLTEAFPEDGEVTAKIIEIRENGSVTCSGTATDQSALGRTLAKLRTARNVADVQLDMVRGKAPMQFTFNFQWAGAVR